MAACILRVGGLSMDSRVGASQKITKKCSKFSLKTDFSRWQAILSLFYFEIEFIKGSSNVLPYFLS